MNVTSVDAPRELYAAFMRSRLWSAESRIDRALLPTLGQMLNDQTGIKTVAETQEEMVKRYTPEL
jgi:hypothetical protein